MTDNLTFDQLPNAVTLLTKEVSELKRLFIEKQDQTLADQSDQLLNVTEAANLLSLTVPTIYSKVSKNELPVCKAPGSKRLYFSRTELLNYIKTKRRKSDDEIEQEADLYLSNLKKGNKAGKGASYGK